MFHLSPASEFLVVLDVLGVSGPEIWCIQEMQFVQGLASKVAAAEVRLVSDTLVSL